MNKKIFNIPIYYFPLLAWIGLEGIIIGSFYDLSISQTVVDTNCLMGKIIETFGMTLGFCMIPIGGVLLLKGLYKNKKQWARILGWGLFLLSLGAGIYFTATNTYQNLNYAEYYLPIPHWAGYLIATILILSSAALGFVFLDSKNKEQLIRIGAAILLCMLLQWLIIELLKHLASRPRYRYLIDLEKNTTGDVFKAWFEFKPFTATSDYFKSFPSGHVGTVSVFLLLPLIAPLCKYQFKYIRGTFIGVSLFITGLVAFYRLHYGAHYLSDISFSLFLTGLLYELVLILSEQLFRKKENRYEVEIKTY